VAVAFFDLDRTLFALNSGALWIRREVAERHITRWNAAQAACYLLAYSVGLVSLERAILRAIGTLKGSRASALQARTRDFFLSYLRQMYRPGALAALDRHRSSGDLCVLLTASPSYLAALVAEDLGLDGYLCTEFEVDEAGIHTGRPRGTPCFGAGKLDHAREFARQARVALEQCAFYTDSYSDLPMLEAIGKPVAVNPDQRLRREAVRRGWPVVDWGFPGQSPPSPSPGSDLEVAPPSLPASP